MPNDDDPTCDACGGPLLPEAEQVAVLREVLARRHKTVPPLRAGMIVRHRYPDQSDEPMASHPAVIERMLTPAEIAARSEGGLAANDMRIFVAPRGIAMSFFCESAEYEPHPDFNQPEAAH